MCVRSLTQVNVVAVCHRYNSMCGGSVLVVIVSSGDYIRLYKMDSTTSNIWNRGRGGVTVICFCSSKQDYFRAVKMTVW